MEPYYTDPNRVNTSPSTAPEMTGGVWPPPPIGQVAALACVFRSLYRRAAGKAAAKANISDLRVGTIQFDAEGLIIQGQAVPRAEIRLAIMLPLVLLSLLFAAIAGTIMEYAARHDERFGVRWSDVKEILLSPAKNEACVVFDAPNYAGNIKTFSLGMRLGPEYYPLFAQSAQQHAPTILSEGRLRNATSLGVWIGLSVFFAIVIGLVIVGISSGHH